MDSLRCSRIVVVMVSVSLFDIVLVPFWSWFVYSTGTNLNLARTTTEILFRVLHYFDIAVEHVTGTSTYITVHTPWHDG
jgi:hypothetical protein